jgi:hypothetical protein
MKVHIEVPSEDQLLSHSVIVKIALKGHSWSQYQLGEYAKSQGIYIIHHGRKIMYVGKTDGPTMSFGARLRREFQENAAKGKHIYPKLASLPTPPEIRVSFLTLSQMQNLLTSEGSTLDDITKIAILEQTLINIYKPELQKKKPRGKTP